MRPLVAAFAALCAALCVAVGGYAAAAAVGALVIVGGPRAGDGPPLRRIFVYASPVHVDIVVPIADDVADWRALVRTPAFPGTPADRRRLAETASHMAFGRGAAAFYLHVRTFDRLRPLHLADSVWDEGLLHATAVADPAAIAGMIALDVSDAGYRRLAQALAAAVGPVPTPVPAESYGPRDGFFRSPDAYSLLRTCNVWAAELLAAAGVAMPLWSPLAFGVERAARRAAAAP
jgi:uncharacterized protein (TIGR02117 family)